MSSLVQSLPINAAGTTSRLGFSTTGDAHWPVWDRYLTVDGRPAHHLGNICNTCAFFFARQKDADRGLGVETLARMLEDGVAALDPDLARELASAMPAGAYDVLLLRAGLQATTHGGPGDYFTGEQMEAWGASGSWDPRFQAATTYYRAGEKLVAPDERLFEFVIPMVPAGDLDLARIDHYRALIDDGREPAALAISVLELRTAEEERHWCLAHYLLDGHHKVEAAARAGKPITLIAFLAHERGLSSLRQIAEAIAVLGGRRARTLR